MRKIITALCVFVLCAAFVFAEEQKEMDPVMKAMMEYATPGPEHKQMADMVGTWDVVMKSYMDPANPTESKGTSTISSILDGRYFKEKFEGSFMEMPFNGMGILGFDNASKKYVTTWIDDMSTGIMMSWGTSPDGGKTINYTGKGYDPMSGKEQTYRSVVHRQDKDHAHFEMYGPGPDGKEMKMFEIAYTRKM